MKRLLATAVAISLLALAAPAGAQTQGGDPFGPLSQPPAEPEAPEPAQPVEEDDGLGTGATLALAGIALLAIGAVFVAISREGRRMDKKARQAHRGRKSKRGARPADLHKRSTSATTGGSGDRRSQGKRPPPPPRKRRPKAKRR
jgi:hypothetical protein